MVFEATDSVRNLYVSSSCVRYAKPIVCTVPDLQQTTGVSIWTTSTALADGALTISEINSLRIYLPLWVDEATNTWKPGWVDLQFTSDASGLVALEMASGWRIYELAKVKTHTESWCLYYCDPAKGFVLNNRAVVSMAWFDVIQVEVSEYERGDSILDTKRQLFLSGPFQVVQTTPAN
jgi:hypothetical protein